MTVFMLAAALASGTLAVQVVEKPRESVVVAVRYQIYASAEAAKRFAALADEGRSPPEAALEALLDDPGGHPRWWEWKRGAGVRVAGWDRPRVRRGRWTCGPAPLALPSGMMISGERCWRSAGGLLETEERALGLVLASERAFDAGGERRVIRSVRTVEIYNPATTRQAPSSFRSDIRLSSLFSRHSSPEGVVNNVR